MIDSPTIHCQIAECSLSTGKRFAPVFSIAALIKSPATTKLSLLDSATSTPAFKARSVGSIPGEPTKAFKTKST